MTAPIEAVKTEEQTVGQMTEFNRRAFILSAAAAPIAGRASAAGQLPRSSTGYRVTDPTAGYFDVSERRQIARELPNLTIIQARLRAMRAPACEKVMAIPIQSQTIKIPSFYEQNAAWRKAVLPFREFEDAVSDLAAANMVATDRRHADCLINLLKAWADQNALAKFNHSKSYRQGWFQVESTLFAVAFALAAVRPDVLHREEDLRAIDNWLLRVARSHFAIPGSAGGTCCNNHFYRRAVYAAIIGVMNRDDQLFSGGVRAIYSALHEAKRDGALPLEMQRGKLAPHYQNFAVMYLAMIAEIAERQGYPVWGLEINGKSLHTLVEFNNKIMADPKTVLKYSGSDEVSLRYRKDMQYFAWYEMYLARFRNSAMEKWIRDRRPMYNRSLGGHLTAYFYNGA